MVLTMFSARYRLICSLLFCFTLSTVSLVLPSPLSAQTETPTPSPTITPTPEPLPELQWVCGDENWIPPLGCPLIDPSSVKDLTFAYLNSCSDCIPPSSECRWEWTHDFPSPFPTPEPPPPPEGCGNALTYLPVIPAPNVPCQPIRSGDSYHSCGYRQDGDEGDGAIARLDLIIPFSKSDLRSITNFRLGWDGANSDVKVTFHWCTRGINDDTACTRKTTQTYSDALYDMTFEYVYQIDISFPPQFVTSLEDAEDWWVLHTIAFCSSGLVFPPTNCGSNTADWYGWGINFCIILPVRWDGEKWTNCVGSQSGFRSTGLDIRYTFDAQENPLGVTISNFQAEYSSPVPMSVLFTRCTTPACVVTQTFNFGIGEPIVIPEDITLVRTIRIYGTGHAGTTANVTVEEATDRITVSKISFCATGDPMFPPPTPEPPLPPTPTPTPDPCGVPNLTSDWWNGSDDTDCQFTTDWNVLIDPSLNSTIPPIEGENCLGAYTVLAFSDPPAPLGFYPTYRYVRQVTVDLLCDEGLHYRFILRSNEGLTYPVFYICQPDTRNGKWVRTTVDFGERDTLNAEFQPYLLIASNYLYPPEIPIIPAADNVLIFSADRKKCDMTHVNDCSIPENVSELHLAFPVSLTVEYSSFDCYWLFPELNVDLTWLNENLRIFVPNVQLCVFWFDLPELHIFGIQISFINILNMACLLYAFNRFFSTFTK